MWRHRRPSGRRWARGRGSAGSRSSLSGSLHHCHDCTPRLTWLPHPWDGLASPYSSCQFHHTYGGVWGSPRASPPSPPGRLHGIDALPPVPCLADQAGLAQHLQVLGHARPSHVEARGDVLHRPRAVAQQIEDVTTCGVGQGGKHLIGGRRCGPSTSADEPLLVEGPEITVPSGGTRRMVTEGG